MWCGKRKKSPNKHGTRSLLDIFPVLETINASGSTKTTSSMAVYIEKVSSKKKRAITPVNMDDSKPIPHPSARFQATQSPPPSEQFQVTGSPPPPARFEATRSPPPPARFEASCSPPLQSIAQPTSLGAIRRRATLHRRRNQDERSVEQPSSLGAIQRHAALHRRHDQDEQECKIVHAFTRTSHQFVSTEEEIEAIATYWDE